ncbi:MAG: anaerobic ribonucleoside-triphosphate reductase activating protein [Clostridia bacterium]|nr:anaerobic ribonucleoside-triphosphate reductase activating protein [Clostridia bacterium]
MEKLSLVDFDRYTACTIFLGGCNYRCPFCHNAHLVCDHTSQPNITIESVLDYLKLRRNCIDALCISGGEPTLNADLPVFIQRVKQLGVKVKLDTNGSNPRMLNQLIKTDLLDYVAMDIKNCTSKYSLTAGASVDISNINASIELLKLGAIPYELRTTLVLQLHNTEDIMELSDWLTGVDKLYLQKFIDVGNCIQSGLTAVDMEQALEYKRLLSKTIDNVYLRGY